MPHLMINYENLAEVCRYLDSQTEEVENFYALLQSQGFDPEAVLDVSRARSIIAYSSLQGQTDELRDALSTGKEVEVEIDEGDLHLLGVMRTLWMDGMLVGSKIARLT